MELKIVSGGQTGVDRAALDAANQLGYETGGWCPKGRVAEDGPIPPGYLLRETPDRGYPQRTEWNVRDSDATLIVTEGPPSGGTAFTIRMAEKHSRAWKLVSPDADETELAAIAVWLRGRAIHVLNVAGPRESNNPGISRRAFAMMIRLLRMMERAEKGKTQSRETTG